MTNDLLKQIKELGFTHDQVFEILKSHVEQPESSEPEDINEEAEPEDMSEPERIPNDEDNESKIDVNEITKKLSDTVTKNINDTITKSISDEIKKQLKKIRNTPPKGELADERGGNSPVIKKNLYETWV